MAKVGRPSDYTQKLADKICKMIAEGESLRKICEPSAMPDKSTVIAWSLGQVEAAREAGFPNQYAQARRVQAELRADEIIEISDDPNEDPQRSRLRVDSRKWYAGKLAPKIYGEKLALTGADGGDLVSRVEVVMVDGEEGS